MKSSYKLHKKKDTFFIKEFEVCVIDDTEALKLAKSY